LNQGKSPENIDNFWGTSYTPAAVGEAVRQWPMEVLGVDSAAGEKLQLSLRYNFKNPGLLPLALAHKSFVNENPGHQLGDNERLEFLGDAVLDLVVSDLMFTRFPQLAEGEMTRVRAEVVSEKNLAMVARELDLGSFLRLGKGERLTGGQNKDSLLADALEAVFGAVYRDGGYDAVRDVVLNLLSRHIELAVERKRGLDYKTRLQELVQARFGIVPHYLLQRASGPDHGKTYQVAVGFNERVFGPGVGRTKKKAEQEAARLALMELGE
jgi:ribonuclease III